MRPDNQRLGYPVLCGPSPGAARQPGLAQRLSRALAPVAQEPLARQQAPVDVRSGVLSECTAGDRCSVPAGAWAAGHRPREAGSSVLVRIRNTYTR
jgi:hypothetical protein